MALQITRDQDTYDDYAQRSSGLGTGSYYWSLLIDYKWNNAASNARIMRLSTSGGTDWIDLYVWVDSGEAMLFTSSSQQSSRITLANGQYATFGIAFSGTTVTLFCRRDNGSDASMATVGSINIGAQFNPTAITIGAPETGGSRSARGSYSRLRYWNANETSAGAGNALLDATQFGLERTLWTPHANKSAYCVGNWSLATDGSDSVGGLTLSLSPGSGNPSFATDEPSYIGSGGGSPIAALARHYAMLRAAS